MKKTLLIACLSVFAGVSALAQSIINPFVERTDDLNCVISKIETTKDYTVVSFEYTAQSDNSWAQINKEMFIKTDLSDKHYDFIKAENIAIAPEKKTIDHVGQKLAFKAYFQKIPKEAKLVDIIENPEGNNSQTNYFNYYNVSLEKSRRAATYAYMAAPANTFLTRNAAFALKKAKPTTNTYSYRVVQTGDDQNIKIDIQPATVAERAKQQKEYFDALIKQGFTEDQAIKIIK